jgi:hypothetical protein
MPDERALFEAWFRTYFGASAQGALFDQPSEHWLDKLDDGRYEWTRLEDAWRGWQARAAL